MEESEYLQEYKLETSIESKNIPKQNTILDACDNEFDNNNNILHFYQQFRESISSNLKKTGYRIGDYELLQDEIITPTFEEVIILWCLDKVQPNLSRKVKIAFNDKLTEGISIHEFKNEIFHHFSGNYSLEEKKQKSVNGSKCNVCDRPFITKSDPDLSNIDPSTLIKEEDIEIHVNSIQDSIKGRNKRNRQIVKKKKYS